jgi:hypothetical protein
MNTVICHMVVYRLMCKGKTEYFTVKSIVKEKAAPFLTEQLFRVLTS